MHYQHLYTPERLGVPPGKEGNQGSHRATYQRDFDRIVFSSAFRRLQDKTQVFPLPKGSAFVHNRLTHSLEVASVGRSLGNLVGQQVARRGNVEGDDALDFYANQLGNVIAAACLCHDIGNPPFGHSGEAAISRFFAHNKPLLADLDGSAREDFLNFEGNANAFRVLASGYRGRRAGGLCLTLPTLAAIGKYPCESAASQGKSGPLARSKYGFFTSEGDTYSFLAEAVGLEADQADGYIAWRRHPFAYLVEAADDICYRVIDLEDAHRLGIVPFATVQSILIELTAAADPPARARVERQLAHIGPTDANERVGVLRAAAIGALVGAAFQAYADAEPAILAGTHNKPLLEGLPGEACTVLKALETLSAQLIYNHRSVVQIEMAGYKVLGGLLEEFAPALAAEKPDRYAKKVLTLLPGQFTPAPEEGLYNRLQAAVDFVAGMTDDFALELFRKIRGIEV